MGTYLEDYVEKITTLPEEIKRNFALMRMLDSDSQSMLRDIKELQKAYVQKARRRVAKSGDGRAGNLAEIAEDKEALAELKAKRTDAMQKADEKVAIADQTYELVDNHIRRLDIELKQFEAELRASGEFDDGGAHKRSRSGEVHTQHAGGGAAHAAAHTTMASAPKRARREEVVQPAVEAVATTAGVAPFGPPEEQPVDPAEPTYCLCNRISFGDMIGCDADDCEIEWFHFECVGLKQQPEGKWYCPSCRARLGIKA